MRHEAFGYNFLLVTLPTLCRAFQHSKLGV